MALRHFGYRAEGKGKLGRIKYMHTGVPNRKEQMFRFPIGFWNDRILRHAHVLELQDLASSFWTVVSLLVPAYPRTGGFPKAHACLHC